ncbi:unnamed protein product [Soboliphyme baturini]|uniref:FHA domain-containing protein n=1 Tax=Soboliphyme baturini TaxID=241478 RepID=A0A183IHG7_9BILA|nr:unnamed protein product [Soboliphyme baturini]
MSPIYGRITIIKPNNEFGGVYEMDKRTCLIGRSRTCNIRIKSNAVEKEHCAVEFNHNGQAFLKNLASHRAVRIFDRRVPTCAKLNHGDIFHVEHRSFKFEYLEHSPYGKIVENHRRPNLERCRPGLKLQQPP